MEIEYSELKATISSVEKDISLITSYQKSAISAGMESLDYPAGRLIEQSLATQYPDFYKIGSGMEGLGDLLSKLKDGLKAAKKMLREKMKPFLDKQSEAVKKEVDKTYASNLWFKTKTTTDNKINANDLGKLIGGFKDFDELKANIDEMLKSFDTSFSHSAKLTRAYVDKSNEQIKNVTKLLKGKTDEEYNEYAKEQIAIFAPLLKELKPASEMPVINSGNGELTEVTMDQAVLLGAMMKELLAFEDKIGDTASDLRMDAGGQDVFDDVERSVDNYLLGELQYNYWYWDVCTWPNTSLGEKIANHIFATVKALENVITSAVK